MKGDDAMDNSISRAEHEEFRRRMEEEHSRINKRLELLEESIDRLHALNTSVEKLAVNMESMLKEQVQQGQRLEVLEKRDGEMWRKVVGYIITAVIGGIIGYIFNIEKCKISNLKKQYKEEMIGVMEKFE